MRTKNGSGSFFPNLKWEGNEQALFSTYSLAIDRRVGDREDSASAGLLGVLSLIGDGKGSGLCIVVGDEYRGSDLPPDGADVVGEGCKVSGPAVDAFGERARGVEGSSQTPGGRGFGRRRPRSTEASRASSSSTREL